MTTWTNEVKGRILGDLEAANQKLEEAKEAIRQKKPDEAYDLIIEMIQLKHEAVMKFPPIDVGNGEQIDFGSLFQVLEKKDLFIRIARDKGILGPAEPPVDIIEWLFEKIRELQILIKHNWKNPEIVKVLEEIIEILYEMIRLLMWGNSATDELRRKRWRKLLQEMMRFQIKFIDLAYGDNGTPTGKTGLVFLMLIELDRKLGNILDDISEWRRRMEDNSDNTAESIDDLIDKLEDAGFSKHQAERWISGLGY